MFGHNSPLLTVSMVINTPPRKNPVKPLRTLPNIEEHNEPEPAPSASAQKQPHTGNPVIDSLIDSDSPEPPAEPKQPAAPKEAAEPALTTRSKPRSVTEELRSSMVSCDLAVEEATAKEEPAVKKESGKPSLGLPANCLESTCEFDPVESDRRDDEVSAKKETPKPSFGLPADCMMSTGEFDPVESDRRDEEPTRFEPIKEEDESDELPVDKEVPVKESVKKETPKHSFGLPADCLESTCEFDPVESDRRDDETPKKETPKHSFGLPADCMMSTGEFDPVESDRRDEEPTRFEPIKEEDESDELPVDKEVPVKESVKKETPKHPFGLPADCLESTCEFDPVESDRRDDETPVKKETPKHSFGLPADCMMSTGEFDPVESDRRDDEPPTRFEPIKEEDESDELPVEKKEETPVMQRNESVKSTGEFDPVESNREEIPLPPPAVGATQISAAVPAKSVRSSGEFDPVESERKDETPASKNPAELTDTVVFSEIPENPAVSVEEVAPAAAPVIPVIPGPLEVTIPSAEENSAELLRMTNSGQNLGGLQFTEETPEEPLVASKVTAIKRKDGLEKEEGVVGKDNSILEKKNSPLDETTVIQLDPDLLNEELEQAEEEEEEEYEERRGCWGCRN